MLFYSQRDAGERAPIVVYLHGLGVGGWCWEPVIDAMPGFSAIVPDFPGHGASSETAWRSIEDAAEKVAGVVGALPADRPVHLTGHSLGAYVGLVHLTARPTRFASAVLSGFHVSPPDHPRLLKLAYVANGVVFRVPPLLSRFAAVFGDEAAARRFVEGAKVIRSRTIRRAGIQVVDFQAPAGLDALALPVLAIAGSREPAAIRCAPGLLAKTLPNAEALVLEGRDHLWPIKEPGLYAQTLKAHLAAHP